MINLESLDPQTTDRQYVSGSNAGEKELRTTDTQELVDGIVGRHSEFFANPANRISYLVGQSPDDFLRLSRYVNAKLRGEKPHQLMRDENEGQGALPMMHTPSKEDKPEAFRRGFAEVQKYLAESSDETEKKLEGAAMAVEALVIWVHPFNDGNGRTSRFLATMIESGVTDEDGLVQQTVSNRARGAYYKDRYQSREAEVSVANNEDILLEDDERVERREHAETLPPDVLAIPMSIKRLLEDDSWRANALNYRKKYGQVTKQDAA